MDEPGWDLGEFLQKFRAGFRDGSSQKYGTGRGDFPAFLGHFPWQILHWILGDPFQPRVFHHAGTLSTI